jgi:hypothetical protein
MKYLVNNKTFTSTFEYKRLSIKLSIRAGSLSSTLMRFEPCFSENEFNDNKELFESLLSEFLSMPQLFLDHWKLHMKTDEIISWVESLNYANFEFRLEEGQYYGSYHDFSCYNNTQLAYLFQEF